MPTVPTLSSSPAIAQIGRGGGGRGPGFIFPFLFLLLIGGLAMWLINRRRSGSTGSPASGPAGSAPSGPGTGLGSAMEVLLTLAGPDPTPAVPPVQGDTDRLTQVLMNVIGNAIQYTEAGTIEVRMNATARAVSIDVVDTGRGLTEVRGRARPSPSNSRRRAGDRRRLHRERPGRWRAGRSAKVRRRVDPWRRCATPLGPG